VAADLGLQVPQALRQEVGQAHPGFVRAEGAFDDPALSFSGLWGGRRLGAGVSGFGAYGVTPMALQATISSPEK
jgi:hypothetical protein